MKLLDAIRRMLRPATKPGFTVIVYGDSFAEDTAQKRAERARRLLGGK